MAYAVSTDAIFLRFSESSANFSLIEYISSILVAMKMVLYWNWLTMQSFNSQTEPSDAPIRKTITLALIINKCTDSFQESFVAYKVSAPIGGNIALGSPIAYNLQKLLKVLQIFFSSHLDSRLLSASNGRRYKEKCCKLSTTSFAK